MINIKKWFGINLKYLTSTNQSIKTSSINFIKSIYKFIKDKIQKFLQEVEPKLRNTINTELDKIKEFKTQNDCKK